MSSATLAKGVGFDHKSKGELHDSIPTLWKLTQKLSRHVDTERNIGTEANVHWRAVPMSDLRKHPHFSALPHPNDLRVGSSYKTLGMYRQDTWQWDALHSGRLTTSRLSCCLGFYEVNAAIVLGVPRSLQGHSRALSAWQELKSKPPSDWTFLSETKLSQAEIDADGTEQPWVMGDGLSVASPFLCTYAPTVEPHRDSRLYKEPNRARLAWGSVQEATAILSAVNFFAKHSPGSVVCEAGMSPFEALPETLEHKQYVDQQAALRDILGSLPAAPSSSTTKGSAHKRPPAFKLGAENIYSVLEQWIRDRKLPLLGASPDGMIRHADGRLEVLEVKCTSPFISFVEPRAPALGEEESGEEVDAVSGGAKRARAESVEETPRMTIMHGFGGSTKNKASVDTPIGVWHVAQLQLEMLCAGAHCRSAVMLRFCISGVKLFRMERDDEVNRTKTTFMLCGLFSTCIAYRLHYFLQYILEMMAIASKFFTSYISKVPSNRMKPPPPNFFDPRKDKKYAAFLARTIQLAENATLIADLRGEEVQRSPLNAHFFV